jgi:tRNA-dihydrouridine synthase B
MLAHAARLNVDMGAQLIDINMGCPAKKVCRRAAGSALMRDESLVQRILEAVVRAAGVPVTLKIRTGWDPASRNGVRIAQIAEREGIAALTVHGRTRACAFSGPVEYDTIRAIRQAVSMPLIANGDIDSPAKAAAVLAHTGADAVMIGRAAQGRPWLFAEVRHYLATGELLPPPDTAAVRALVLEHLDLLHDFYGAAHGLRVARKHLAWYAHKLPGAAGFRQRVNRAETTTQQRQIVAEFFSAPTAMGEQLAA